MKLCKLSIVILTYFFLITNCCWPGIVSIPLDNSKNSFESSDLVNGEPIANSMWSNLQKKIDDQKMIFTSSVDGEGLVYRGSIGSIDLVRFNVLDKTGKTMIVNLGRNLHTLLLRKNILRLIGYNIPPIKYVPSLKIKFRNAEEIKFFKLLINERLESSENRWIKNTEGNVLTLIDVAVTAPSESDYYSAAFGVPIRRINSRVINGLSVAYAWLNLEESVQAFPWSMGIKDENKILLSHFLNFDFNTSKNDALWMINKLNTISKSDIDQAIKEAFFPAGVAELLLEKLLSRRNKLSAWFGVYKADEYNEKLDVLDENVGPDDNDYPKYIVQDGKILGNSFPGFASIFNYGDAKSPFKDLQKFFYAKMQSSGIDNLVSNFNFALKGKSLAEGRARYYQNLFMEGLNHFIATGEFLPIKMGTWFSFNPGMNLILSRDFILGNFLGTTNIMQLADTIGFSMSLGGYWGVESIADSLSGNLNADYQIVRTYTHVRPLKTLGDFFNVPYKNIMVHLSKINIADAFSKNNGELEKISALIDAELGVGESLIITDRYMPQISFSTQFIDGVFNVNTNFTAGIYKTLRLHILRKNSDAIQIFDDEGNTKEFSLAYNAGAKIPIFGLRYKKNKGESQVLSTIINFKEKDPITNEYKIIKMSSDALVEFILNNKRTLLDQNFKTIEIKNEHNDHAFNANFLMLQYRHMRTSSNLNASTKDNTLHGQYLHLSQDSLWGLNYEALAKQIINIRLTELYKGKYLLNGDSSGNPSDTFWGSSTARHLFFDAVYDNNKIGHPIISKNFTKAGWYIDRAHVLDFISEVNGKFKTQVFDPLLIKFQGLRLYRLNFSWRIFDRGLEDLKNYPLNKLAEIDKNYPPNYFCQPLSMEDGDISECKEGKIIAKLKECKAILGGYEIESNRCYMQLWDDLTERYTFSDLTKIININHMSIRGSIDGFRENDELLNKTIYSNGIGVSGAYFSNLSPLEYLEQLTGVPTSEFLGNWQRDTW